MGKALMPGGFRLESRRFQSVAKPAPRVFPGRSNCLDPRPVLRAKCNEATRRLTMPEAIDLLTSRRSVKPIELSGPGPTAAELATLLTVASRVPDHGKLTPWRFIVFDGDARLNGRETLPEVVLDQRPDATPHQVRHENR